jgi:hypothetical protein
MWTKSRFANWETEGAVRERVDKALAESEQRRLAEVAAGSQDMGLLGRMLAKLKTRSARLFVGVTAERAPAQSQDARADRSPAQSAIEATPDTS